jgi:hypothetical protein
MTDTIVYWVCVISLIAFIVWLPITPAPGHDPQLQFTNAMRA